MAYTHTSRKHAMQRRMRTQHVPLKFLEERFPTALNRALRLLITLDKYISWGPWRDLTTTLYTKPFKSIDVYRNGRYHRTERWALKDLDNMVDLTDQDKENDCCFITPHFVYLPQIHLGGDQAELALRLADELTRMSPATVPQLIKAVMLLNTRDKLGLQMERKPSKVVALHQQGPGFHAPRAKEKVLVRRAGQLILRISPTSHELQP